jgi:hypothetical protein
LKSIVVEDKIEHKAEDDEDTKSVDSEQLEIIITEIDTESNVETATIEFAYLEPVLEQNEKIVIEEKKCVYFDQETEKIIQTEYNDFKKKYRSINSSDEPILEKYKNIVDDQELQYKMIMRYDQDFNNRLAVIQSFNVFRAHLIRTFHFDETHSVYASIELQIINRLFEMFQKLNERYDIKSNYNAIKHDGLLKCKIFEHPKVQHLFEEDIEIVTEPIMVCSKCHIIDCNCEVDFLQSVKINDDKDTKVKGKKVRKR